MVSVFSLFRNLRAFHNGRNIHDFCYNKVNTYFTLRETLDNMDKQK